MIHVFSRGIRRLPHLETFLEESVTPSRWAGGGARAVAGWGLRPSARRARRYAQRHGLPYLALEDGFLRSVFPGPTDAPLAIAIDDLGSYYDASRPSRLEALIAKPLTAAQTQRAQALLLAWREARLSKYNHLREYQGELPQSYVLVVDQTFGDASVRYGQATPESFTQMLDAALTQHPDCTVLVKIHPDVFARRRRGYFDAAGIGRMPRVQVLAENVHPVRLIEAARAIYTVTSQVGFEGLLWGKPVHTFGMPFYAGWGLTEDALPGPARRTPATLEQLVHAALIDYPRYVHPETNQRCQPEEIVAHLALQRRMRQRFAPELYACGFSPYKRPLVRRFCWGSRVRFVSRPSAAPKDAPLLVWGQPKHPAATLHLEDGFLRSVGLGADLVRPISWVMDARGIYYDPTQPSDLEHLLQTSQFDDALLSRAQALRQRILAANLTKYNVGTAGWRPLPAERRVILVPGQVESDASLALGAAGIKKNLDLLRAVRAANPEAWVVYKPHPDVVAGLRTAGSDEADAPRWCDEVIPNAAMSEVLDQVDEVHTITSLTGFEALLRGKAVTCYGQPFYAGWGLTDDLQPTPRRRRCLSVDELVAGTLILYPTYVSRTTGRFTTPERALTELSQWREQAHPSLPLWRRALRQALRWRAN